MEQNTFAQKNLAFYKAINPTIELPVSIVALNIFNNTDIQSSLEVFFEKFFSDTNKRIPVLGINPGRFGSGVTGIPFTDPEMLSERCGIENTFVRRQELTSRFIYTFIENFGGVKSFYSKFVLGAVSPLGFVKKGRNYNYYDDSETLTALRPFIDMSLRRQREICGTDVAILLGTGKNTSVFSAINNDLRLFKYVLSLEHPRFVMQYNRRHMVKYLHKYKDTFDRALDLARMSRN